MVDRHARVGSGGVGILISDSILSDFHVSEIVDTFEGSLAVLLKHKYREKSIVVICSYLPPEHTKYGVEPDIFFEALTQLIYMYTNVDLIILGGDYNGDKQDYIDDVDNISKRQSVDPTTNKHGDCLLDFCRDTQFAIVDGRITPQYNKYTSITKKGNACVDYVLVNYECLKYVKECKVLSIVHLLHGIRAENPTFPPPQSYQTIP